ncbi:MAG: DUF2807 domain-containing protein [Ignavibacteria bacterium]|nr:DUF2807 domain-containing protein [Ignavibacteria bacterium]
MLLISFSSAGAQSVKGNGTVSKRTYNVGSFDKIELNGIFNTVLSQGTEEKVVIETDENLQQYLKPVVSGGTLLIETNEDVNIRNTTKMEVHVTLRNLSTISNNGVGNISSQGKLSLGDLKIESNGVGNIKLDMDAGKLVLEMASVGNIKLEGSADQGDFLISGVGNVKAEDMAIKTLKIKSSGVGNASVYVTGLIYPEIEGAGNIRCKGNPTVKDLKQNGIGTFKLKDD